MEKIRKRKSAADRKAEIVDTVIEMSALIGPDRVTTQHLADRVGVTQPAIFRHFATKADIWDAVAERLTGLVDELVVVAANSDPSHNAIADHLRRYLSLVVAFPALPMILASKEIQADAPTLQEKFTKLMSRKHEQMTKMVRHAQADNRMRADMDAGKVSVMILAAINGLCLRWCIDSGRFNLIEEGEFLISSLTDSLSIA